MKNAKLQHLTYLFLLIVVMDILASIFFKDRFFTSQAEHMMIFFFLANIWIKLND